MIMEYAYATCILNESGKEINENNLTAVLDAAGCEVQKSRVKAIVAALEDVDIDGVTSVDIEALDADPAHNGGPTSDENSEGDEPALGDEMEIVPDKQDDSGDDVPAADGSSGEDDPTAADEPTEV